LVIIYIIFRGLTGLYPLRNCESRTMVKGGCADVAMGKRWISTQILSAFCPLYAAMPRDQ